jgi:hypothetical protein
LHDTIQLERLDVCAVPVATHEFMNAARAQAVYVPHPIQDQTKSEIEARADAVLDEIVARLTGAAPA